MDIYGAVSKLYILLVIWTIFYLKKHKAGWKRTILRNWRRRNFSKHLKDHSSPAWDTILHGVTK